ncbi:MAG: DinB family protein [Gemmatimonadaceae bacterium]
MGEIERTQKLMEYDAWANVEAVRSLQRFSAMPAVPERTSRLIAHIIGAEWNWLARIRGEQPRMAIWPEIAPSDLERELADVQFAWRAYFEVQSANELNRVVTYANSKGDEYRNTVSDIVTHVSIHSEHHRGQIAQTVRALGGQPALTDYIHYARTVGT